jgi:hypothetical protein
LRVVGKGRSRRGISQSNGRTEISWEMELDSRLDLGMYYLMPICRHKKHDVGRFCSWLKIIGYTCTNLRVISQSLNVVSWYSQRLGRAGGRAQW